MTFFDWFAHNPAAIVYVGTFIVALFLFWLSRFFVGVSQAKAQIKSIEQFADDTSTEMRLPQGTPLKAATRSAATERFDLYRRGLVMVGQPSGPSICSTRPAADIFDADALSRETLNLRFYQSVPNILVGIGLLFTFLGLTIALHFAAEGATSTNIAQTQASLNSLLQAAAFKFISSLIALSCSIVFLFAERLLIRSYQERIDALISQLDRSFPPVTAESLLSIQLEPSYARLHAEAIALASRQSVETAFDPFLGDPKTQFQIFLQNIRDIVEENKEQSLALKNFDTTLAVSISKAIETSLAPSIVSTFGKLETTIAEMSSKMQSANADILQGMISEFSQTLQARTTESFNGIVTSANELTITFKDQKQLLTTSYEALNDLLISAREYGRNGLREASDATASLNAITDKLTGLAQTMQEAGAPLAAAAVSVGGVIDRLHDLQLRSASAVENMNELTTTLDGSLKLTADSSRAVAQDFRAQLESAFNSYRNGFGAIDKDLAAAFQAMQDGIAHTMTHTQAFVRDSDEGVARAIQGVNSSVSSLETQIEELEDVLSRFVDQVARNNEREGRDSAA